MHLELLTHSALFINNVLLTHIFIIYTKRTQRINIIYKRILLCCDKLIQQMGNSKKKCMNKS